MSTTKSAGSTKLGRDSIGQRLGVKLFEGERVHPGMVLIRQRGARYLPGKNVKKAADDTLYSLANGKVLFSKRRKMRFDGSQRMATYVHVVPGAK